MDLESLDVKDRRLLLALDMGARKTDSAIANEIGLSKQVTNYRIKRLESRNIIKSYYAIVDHTKIGLKLYRVGLKLENVDNDKEREIIDYLKSRGSWIVTVFGSWDVFMGIYTKDEYDLMDFWKKFSDKYGYYVSDKWISLMTKSWKFEKSFIFPKKKDRKNSFVLGHKSSSVNIDEIDHAILQQLTINARQSTFDLAKKVKQTERIVQYRIKKLEENGVILGYRALINTALLGLKFYKIFVQLKNADSKDRQQIRGFVIQHPNVGYITEAAGGSDLEFEGHFTDSRALFEFITELKDSAPTLIKDVVYLEYVKEHKITYYPVS
ncbi:Lrp/AsnC family transcriptional regulator [Candidatus Micrarchaeota archaeon]|nr:Lrp/AsnC family transcriptional regulator [Candidatus Micrarchaeota archaeon]